MPLRGVRWQRVQFSDAEALLLDPNALTRDDPTAKDERRFVSPGLDAVRRVGVGVHACRDEGLAADFGSACDAQ